MTDDMIVMIVCAFWVLLALTIVQQVRISRLRRKYEQLLTDELTNARSLAFAPSPTVTMDQQELVALKSRVQVLERIATDPADRLGDQFEALRSEPS